MTMSTVHIGPGAILKKDDQHLCVLRFQTHDSVLVSVVETGQQKVFSVSEIAQIVGSRAVVSEWDLNEVDQDAWSDALEKFKWIEPLLFKPDRTHADVEAVGQELLVSRMTMYRWIKKLEQQGNIRCLLRQRRGDIGEKRLSKEVEDVIERVVREKYLTTLKRSPTATYKEVKDECHRLKLPVPGKNTLVRRIELILPEEREHRRRGPNAALKFRAIRGSLPGGTNSLYSIWQIDHTQVDIELVDSVDRIAIGRPWITLVIDTFSRMVVGWYISFDPPGSLGTGLAITSAILAKDSFMARLGINYLWPCQGKPRVIHCDNAKEFHGTALQTASQEHGFELRFRKKKKPQYGSYIERLLGTLSKAIHTIEGTTFSNVGAKEEYDSAGNAVLTLDNFERWLAHEILGDYHLRMHSELGKPPLSRFNEGLLGTPEFPGLGTLPISGTPEQLRLDFLPTLSRTIQVYGVKFDYIDYYDAVLDKWIGSDEPGDKRNGRQFLFRYDPRDISTLYFWDPQLRKYFPISYRNVMRPAISYWELTAVRRYMTAQGIKDVDEEAIFRSREARREILNVETALTRSAAKERERHRAHEKIAGKPTSSKGVDSVSPSYVPIASRNAPAPKDLDLQNLAVFDEFEEV